MKRRAHLIVLASLMLPAVAQQPQTKPATREAKAPQAREKAELKLGQRIDGNAIVVDLDGKPCKLQGLLGKVTVLNFHSTQSNVQRDADEHFATLQRDFAKHNVAFLHINSNAKEIGLRAQKAATNEAGGKTGSPQPYARIRNYLRKHKLPFRVFADHHNQLADALGALTTPHVFVFAGDGTLVYRGPAKHDKHKHLRDVLAKLVNGAKVEPFEILPYGNAISRAAAHSTPENHTIVFDDPLLARKTSLREDKLLIYNFTGFNCNSCRMMEDWAFVKDEVRALMRDHVVEARLHCDTQHTLTAGQLATNRKLQGELTNSKVTPIYVAVDPFTGKSLGTFTLSGDYKTWPTEWRKFVKQMAAKADRIPK